MAGLRHGQLVLQDALGRVELGMGAGWYEAEHTAYGIPFPALGERFDRFEEQLEIITGLWDEPDGGRFSFKGTYFTVADSPALPKPVQRPRPPLIIGGAGKRRTPRLAAKFADEYNVPFGSLEDTGAAYGRVREACAAAGRHESSMIYSAAHMVCCGRSQAEIDRRAAAVGRRPGEGLVGTPGEIAEMIGQFAEIGAEHFYLQVLDLNDLDHLELLAAEVLPQV